MAYFPNASFNNKDYTTMFQYVRKNLIFNHKKFYVFLNMNRIEKVTDHVRHTFTNYDELCQRPEFLKLKSTYGSAIQYIVKYVIADITVKHFEQYHNEKTNNICLDAAAVVKRKEEAIERLDATKEELNNQVFHLKKQNKSLKSQNTRYRNTNKHLTEENEILTETVNTLSEQEFNSRSQLDELIKRLDIKEVELSERDKFIQEQRVELSERDKFIQEQREALKEHKESLVKNEESLKEHKESLKEHKEALVRSEKLAVELREELRTAKIRITDLEEQVRTLTIRVNILEQDVAEIKSRLFGKSDEEVIEIVRSEGKTKYLTGLANGAHAISHRIIQSLEQIDISAAIADKPKAVKLVAQLLLNSYTLSESVAELALQLSICLDVDFIINIIDVVQKEIANISVENFNIEENNIEEELLALVT